MTSPTHTTARADSIAADIRQLTQPIYLAAGRRIIHHPCLLDQLRAATTPGGTTHTGPGRGIPGSRPPVRLAAVDTLAEVYSGITAWRMRLRIPSPPRDQDWHIAVLSALAAVAGEGLEPAIASWLALEVHTWWYDAATVTGWRPSELIRLR